MTSNYDFCTAEKQGAFLESLGETCNVTETCRRLNLQRTLVYFWKRNQPEFAEAWEEAMRLGLEALEDEVRRRAFIGTDRPVFHQGQECGVVREYSDTLAIFLLKGAAPEKYRDNHRVELGNIDDKPFQVTQVSAEIATLLATAKERKESGDEPG